MTALQTLGQHAQADAVMPNQLQQIAAASAEGIQRAIERVFRQHLLYQHRQTLHALPHIGVAAGQVDPDIGLQRNHRRANAASTRRSAPLSTCASTRTLTPPGSAISIIPSECFIEFSVVAGDGSAGIAVTSTRANFAAG